MAFPYTPKTFLLHVNSPLLEEYFRRLDLHCKIDFTEDILATADSALTAIERLPREIQFACEADFQAIWRLGNRAGRDAIVAASQSRRLRQAGDEDFIQLLAPVGSYLEQAFWAFLHRRDYFEGALLLADSDAVANHSWEHHPRVLRVEPNITDEELSALANGLSRYFHAIEGRETRCVAKAIERADRWHISCVFEGPTIGRPAWVAEGLRRQAERQAQPLLFMYSTAEGKLDVYLRASSARIYDVMDIFAQTILGMKKLDPPPHGKASYDLDRFKRRGRHFIYGAESGISSAAVRRIRLTSQLGPKTHVILEGLPFGSTEPIYDMLRQDLNSLNVDDFDVTQVEIKIVFGQTPYQRRRTIPVTLTSPNRCSIGYDDQELIVRKMLIDSRIETPPSTAPTEH